MTVDPQGDSSLAVLHEERNRAGGRTRIREMDYQGGKIVIYEYITQQQTGGIAVQQVSATSMIFVPPISKSSRKTRKK